MSQAASIGLDLTAVDPSGQRKYSVRDFPRSATVNELLETLIPRMGLSANDPVGYVCHRLAYEQGGYESDTATNLAPGAGELIQVHALKLLDSLK